MQQQHNIRKRNKIMKQNCHELENMFLHLLRPTSSKISQYYNVDHYLLESYALHEKMCQDSLKLSQSIEEAKMFRMDYSIITKNVIPVTIKQILSCLRNFVDVFERYILDIMFYIFTSSYTAMRAPSVTMSAPCSWWCLNLWMLSCSKTKFSWIYTREKEF